MDVLICDSILIINFDKVNLSQCYIIHSLDKLYFWYGWVVFQYFSVY
jgi:hypothetical protein